MRSGTSLFISSIAGTATFLVLTILGKLVGIELFQEYAVPIWVSESRDFPAGEETGAITMLGLFALLTSAMIAWRVYRSCIFQRLDGGLSANERFKSYLVLIGTALFVLGFEYIWALKPQPWIGHVFSATLIVVLLIGAMQVYRWYAHQISGNDL